MLAFQTRNDQDPAINPAMDSGSNNLKVIPVAYMLTQNGCLHTNFQGWRNST